MKKSSIGFIFVVSVLIVTSILSLRMFLYQRSDHDILDIHTFPLDIGDWKGKDLEIKDYEYEILETKNLILREYTNPSNQIVNLFIIYSETNRSVFHPPEVCLIGSGIAITEKKDEAFKSGKKDFLLNKMYLQKNDAREIALYCYKSGNFYTNNYYLQQIHFTLNQLFGQHRGGATIRVIMRVGNNKKETEDTLHAFLKLALANLEKLQ